MSSQRKKAKKLNVKLLPHETALLLESDELADVAHAGSTAAWLWAKSDAHVPNTDTNTGRMVLDRHMAW